MVFAPAETEEAYRSLADQLLSRGIDPHAPLVVVSDGAQVIPAAFSRSFTNVAFQRCQWHLAQEIKEFVPPAAKEQARRSAWRVLRAPTTAIARERLQRLRAEQRLRPDALASLDRPSPTPPSVFAGPLFSAPTAAPNAVSASFAATTCYAKPSAPTATPFAASPSGPASSTPHIPDMIGSPTSSPLS